MALTDDLADELARETIVAMERFGNDRLYVEVGKVLGASSTTLQEAFLTSIRVRLAERRGRRFLEDTIKAAETGAAAPVAPRESDAGH
ncbi:MAG: hypothetical protein DI533_02265 [Cereibacter sphaeroides]|uniref:Uncharacterized protein n=1 Tax=Cereibacter sphaeroides TaxID=1063 RepID=A0A2W5SCB6_CERSP|nr:MAG: hypothetical protein DI533_02265 [Cereibacter sphaeroides]